VCDPDIKPKITVKSEKTQPIVLILVKNAKTFEYGLKMVQRMCLTD